LEEALELLEERLGVSLLFRVGLGVRMDEIEPQAPEEQLAHEGRRFPGGLTRRFRDRACFQLADVSGLWNRGGLAHGSSGIGPRGRPLHLRSLLGAGYRLAATLLKMHRTRPPVPLAPRGPPRDLSSRVPVSRYEGEAVLGAGTSWRS